MQISGMVSCRDDGGSYVYTVDFLHYRMARDIFNVGVAHANWFGLAAYNCDGEKVISDWVYDEARPINVNVSKAKAGLIGRLSFAVPKSAFGSTTAMTFYTTVNGSAEQAWFR